MAPRINGNIAETTCYKCNKEVKNFVTCSKCSKSYHPSCILKIGGLYVRLEGQIVCCEDLTSKKCQCQDKDLEIQKLKIRLADLNGVLFEQSMSEMKTTENISECSNEDIPVIDPDIPSVRDDHRKEVKYLNRIIEEKSNMISELHDKIVVLKKYITLIENVNENKRMAPSLIVKENKHFSETEHERITESENISTKKSKLPAIKYKEIKHTKEKTTTMKETCPVEENTKIVHEAVNANMKAQSANERKERNRQIKKNIGVTGTCVDSSVFSAVPKRVWLYVGHVGVNVEESHIENHLKEKFPSKSFVIEKLPKRVTANTVSFKIGADLSLLDDIYRPENWPLGVVIRRFRFFRETNGGSC